MMRAQLWAYRGRMTASGRKRADTTDVPNVGLGRKAEVSVTRRRVRCWLRSDVSDRTIHFRYYPNSGHRAADFRS